MELTQSWGGAPGVGSGGWDFAKGGCTASALGESQRRLLPSINKTGTRYGDAKTKSREGLGSKFY